MRTSQTVVLTESFHSGLGKSSEQRAFSVFTDLRTTVNGLGVCLSALPSERRSAGTLMMPSAGPHTVEIHVAAHRLGHWCRCPFAAQITVPTTGTRHHTRRGSVPSIMDGARSKGVSEAEATIACQTATPAQTWPVSQAGGRVCLVHSHQGDSHSGITLMPYHC